MTLRTWNLMETSKTDANWDSFFVCCFFFGICWLLRVDWKGWLCMSYRREMMFGAGGKKKTERKMEKMRDESSDCARYMLILFSLAEQPGQSVCAFKSDQSQNRSSTKILHTTVASGTSGKDNISLIHWFGYCSLNAFSCTVIFTGFQFRTIRSIAKIWWNWNMTIATRIWLLHAADVVWRKCTYTGYRWGE